MTIPSFQQPSSGTAMARIEHEAEAAVVPASATSSHSSAASALSAAIQPRTAAATAAPGLNPGHDPEPDDSSGDPIPSASPGARRGRRSGLSRLRIGWHTIPAKATSHLGSPSAGPGLILGLDGAGRPVAVPIFGPEPVRVALVGDRWTAKVLVLRALALGAAVVVVTSDPAPWRDFGRIATGEPDRVLVVPDGRPVTAYGSATRPALLVYDLGGSAPQHPRRPGPWQTRLTVIHPAADPASVSDCELLLAQHPDAATNNVLMVVHSGIRRTVRITPTSVELQLFGPPLTSPAG